MQIIRDLPSTLQISDPAIRKLVQQRIKSIASDEPYDANLHGYFVVLATGDTVEAINAMVSLNVLEKQWEILEEYPCCWDLLYIVDDSGYGVELFIPKTVDIPELLAMCQHHAVPGTV